MAVTWDWKCKCGEIKIEFMNSKGEWQKNKFSLYSGGNCWLVMLYEYKKDGEDYYNLQGFFIDKTHMNRCLGLAKGHDNSYEDNGHEKFKSVKLSASKNEHANDIAKAFKKARPDIKVVVEY